MSGVLKGVGKVFKKVAKFAVKVLPAVLAIGAVVFTAGAALGVVGPMAAGWGGAVSSLVGQLGAGSLLSSTLTGAITAAGYGAAMGAVGSVITGGNIMDGMARGAIAGGITGGIGGAAGNIFGLGADAAAAGSAADPLSIGGASAIEEPLISSAASALPSGGAAAGSSPGLGGLLTKGGWLERNQELVGGVVKGIGGGLLQSSADESAEEAALKRDRQRQQLISSNYGSGQVSGYRPVAETRGNPTPTQRYSGGINTNGTYQYDPQQNRIVFVPDTAKA